MKNLLKISLLASFLTTGLIHAQCGPVSIPALGNSLGGRICLLGFNPFGDYCISNDLETENGTTSSYFKITKTEIPTHILKINEKKMSLGGQNPEYSTYDLSFDFLGAGSAKIRSQRGSLHDTKLQFMTNPTDGQLNGSITRMIIDSDGDVGINLPIDPDTNDFIPSDYKLNVFGVAKFTDEFAEDSKLVIKGNWGTNNIIDGIIFQDNSTTLTQSIPTRKRDLSFEFVSAGSSTISAFRGKTNDTYIQFLTTNKNNTVPSVKMQINEDGKVIIGNNLIKTNTINNYKLYVEGGILTEKLKVALSSNTAMWADYVFDPNYKLKSLYEVEEYINLNKHLPNIPSSEEIKKEGIEVPEMLSKQMEKIEELTLYLIEMKKDIDALKNENENLKRKITNLKD